MLVLRLLAFKVILTLRLPLSCIRCEHRACDAIAGKCGCRDTLARQLLMNIMVHQGTFKGKQMHLIGYIHMMYSSPELQYISPM